MIFKIKKFLKNNIDGYTAALLATVLLAAVLPVYGRSYEMASLASKLVVALLFFLHGVKLSPQNLWAGLTHWRLHLIIIAATFIMFPLLAILLKPMFIFMVGDSLCLGIIFLCILPSTVQSSIAFTSIAGGNVAAAICAASASSLLGVLITPILAGWLLGAASGGFSEKAVIDLFWQIIFPFILGQTLRFKLIRLINNKSLISYVDRLSILFIVYVSFSHGTTSGLWATLSWPLFLSLILTCCIILALALLGTNRAGKIFGLNKADRIAVVFCGSKKSLASGVPMANIIFPAALASTIILPLMVFHQIQLMVCALIAKKIAAQSEKISEGESY